MKLSNRIKIHPVTLLFLTVGCLTGYIKYMIYIFAILLVHELGHIIAILFLKRSITEITVLPFGGLIKMNSLVSSNIFEDELISIAGVAAQTILGFILIYLKEIQLLDVSTFYFLNNYNIMIILFNLVPICPLDGYKIFKGFLELFIPFKATFVLSLAASTSIILIVLLLDRTIVFDNPFVFSFLIYAIWEEAKNIKYIMMRFYIERMNRKFVYPIKYVEKVNSMYKNKVHFIECLPEDVYLKKLFTRLNK